MPMPCLAVTGTTPTMLQPPQADPPGAPAWGEEGSCSPGEGSWAVMWAE